MVPMSPLPAAGDELPTWTVAEHGAFLVGQCPVCGFQSAARRARYSVESDMRAHEILCHARQTLDAVPVEAVPVEAVPVEPARTADVPG